MKLIEQYTTDELSKKIEAIKSEREKTADALKRYEEELERRKQEVPLGVPVITDTLNETFYSVSGTNEVWSVTRRESGVQEELLSAFNLFCSEESAEKHAEMLLAWRKALVANAKCEQIDIKVLCPLLQKGKVLFSPYDEKWKWIERDAIVDIETNGWFIRNSQAITIEGFNIKPAEDWRNSLTECGL